jgi:catalase
MVTPEEAIDAVHEQAGIHPGWRALHAKGVLLRGGFTASAEAASLSRAAHLRGDAVPALVRFSNGAGKPTQADNKPGVRGMAVKLSLPGGATTDISSQTARLFTSSTPEGFVELMRAVKPDALAGYRLARYALRYPEILRGLRQNSVTIRVPASYATVGYHALHAFEWVDQENASRFVRYHWIPQAGEHYLTIRDARSKAADFLTDELITRLADGPIRFDLQVQIAGPDDSTVDPSAPWASTQMATVGTLEITGLDTEREHDGDIVVFDPMRVTDGIKPSQDPVLHFRSYAYSVSVKDRSGVSRGPEAP